MRSASPALLLFVLVLALAGFAAFVAYRFMSPSYVSSAVVDVDAPTPRESLETLLRLRAAGDYDGMKAWIVPARSEAVARTLRSIDAFLAADAELRRAVRDEIALGIAQSLDLSALAERLEVFSRHVELLHETVQGDAAVVSFQIDRKVPLRDARLALVGGRWLYDPGAGYRDDLPEAFDLLTRGVRELLAELRSDRWTAEELQMRPEILAAALREKLEPGLRRLRSAGGEEGPQLPPPPYAARCYLRYTFELPLGGHAMPSDSPKGRWSPLVPPEMTILADHAILHPDADEDDLLELAPKLAAVFDIIRNRNTRTPMSVAFYGGWGTGKSSAMRWLRDRLVKWNAVEPRERAGHATVETVWFDPWKYQT